MLKCVYQLVTGQRNKVGNHKVVKDGCMLHFFYYWTEICTANTSTKEFYTTNGG